MKYRGRKSALIIIAGLFAACGDKPASTSQSSLDPSENTRSNKSFTKTLVIGGSSQPFSSLVSNLDGFQTSNTIEPIRLAWSHNEEFSEKEDFYGRTFITHVYNLDPTNGDMTSSRYFGLQTSALVIEPNENALSGVRYLSTPSSPPPILRMNFDQVEKLQHIRLPGQECIPFESFSENLTCAIVAGWEDHNNRNTVLLTNLVSESEEICFDHITRESLRPLAGFTLNKKTGTKLLCADSTSNETHTFSLFAIPAVVHIGENAATSANTASSLVMDRGSHRANQKDRKRKKLRKARKPRKIKKAKGKRKRRGRKRQESKTAAKIPVSFPVNQIQIVQQLPALQEGSPAAMIGPPEPPQPQEEPPKATDDSSQTAAPGKTVRVEGMPVRTPPQTPQTPHEDVFSYSVLDWFPMGCPGLDFDSSSCNNEKFCPPEVTTILSTRPKIILAAKVLLICEAHLSPDEMYDTIFEQEDPFKDSPGYGLSPKAYTTIESLFQESRRATLVQASEQPMRYGECIPDYEASLGECSSDDIYEEPEVEPEPEPTRDFLYAYQLEEPQVYVDMDSVTESTSSRQQDVASREDEKGEGERKRDIAWIGLRSRTLCDFKLITDYEVWESDACGASHLRRAVDLTNPEVGQAFATRFFLDTITAGHWDDVEWLYYHGEEL